MEGLFAKTFRSGLQPVELAKRILKEMEARRTVGVRDTWAPNDFVFTLAPGDAVRFEQAETVMAAELEQVVRDGAAERGWGLVGPAHVAFEVGERLKKGEFRCDAQFVEGTERVEPTKASGASLVIADGQERRTVPLHATIVTIGRLPECEVVLRDPGASRRHAQIREQAGVYTLTDLGSTNGTTLNGQTVQTRELAEGDRIQIGNTILEFRVGG